MKWLIVPILILATGQSYILWQPIAAQFLSGVFGAVDGIQEFNEANPVNPHPAAKIPSSD